MTQKIIFHTNSIAERGVSVAVYDYAFYIREYFNLEPIIVYNLRYENHQNCVSRFKKIFNVIGYEDFSEVQQLIDKQNIKYFYAIKYGINDGIQVKNCKNLIHSVFCSDISQMHGDKYAVVSEWLSYKSDYKIPYVPHMINLPDHDLNFRDELAISKSDVIVGRYGGKDTLNIDFVKSSIINCLEKRNNIWFLFLNTEHFYSHPRCLYFDAIIDYHEKTKFINTCDAFLHARDYGETFGQAVLEFACKNKQIITYDNYELQENHPLGGRNHFLYLKDNCFKYSNSQDLQRIFLDISKNSPFETYYLNKLFSPKTTMNKFNEIFL